MKLLDLFCGAGGAAMGYHLAGFEHITGIDVSPQPRYPFRFIQGDALEYLTQHGHEFDVVHASPPCQGYSSCRHLPGREDYEYPKLIDAVRQQLRSYGKSFIIENVPGAPLENPLVLEGRQFGLKVLRKRLFECSPWLMGPPLPILRRRRYCAPLSEFDRGQYGFVGVYGQRFEKAKGAAAMQIDWMTRAELAQAIPPAYTEFIGRELLRILQQQETRT